MGIGDFAEKTSGLFGGLKEKLPFGRKNEEFDEYDDYEEYNDEFGDYTDENLDGDVVEDNASYNDSFKKDFDSPYRANRSATTSASRYQFDKYDDNIYSRPSRPIGGTSPDLISYSEVKTHARFGGDINRQSTAVPNVPQYGKAPGADFVSPYEALNNPDYHSDGLNSLFTPTTQTTNNTLNASPVYSPYDSFSAPSQGFGNARKVDVVRVLRFDDVEEVSRRLRAGNVVVIALRGCRDDIAHRVLDFSFGAAAMVEAHVDKLAGDVYVIATGSALMPDEIAQLRNQGVL